MALPVMYVQHREMLRARTHATLYTQPQETSVDLTRGNPLLAGTLEYLGDAPAWLTRSAREDLI